jgi:hypothetical protein
MNIKDGSKMWIVCNKCGAGIDVSKGGRCGCSNDLRVSENKDEVKSITANDSDEVVYDNG